MSGGTSNFLSYRMKPLRTLFALTSAVRRRRLMLPVLSVPAPSYSTGFCCFFTVIQGSHNAIFSQVCSYLGFQVFVLEGQVFEPPQSAILQTPHLTKFQVHTYRFSTVSQTSIHLEEKKDVLKAEKVHQTET